VVVSHVAVAPIGKPGDGGRLPIRGERRAALDPESEDTESDGENAQAYAVWCAGVSRPRPEALAAAARATTSVAPKARSCILRC
jgi:hypothetical protein